MGKPSSANTPTPPRWTVAGASPPFKKQHYSLMAQLPYDPSKISRELSRHYIPASEADIQAQIQARAQAKKDRDFATADRIRQELAAQGVVLKDSPTGTTWEAAS